MEQGIFLTEQGIIFAEQGNLAPEQGIGPRTNFLTVRGAMMGMIGGGTNEIQRNVIAQRGA
jgi:hypothetical protein